MKKKSGIIIWLFVAIVVIFSVVTTYDNTIKLRNIDITNVTASTSTSE